MKPYFQVLILLISASVLSGCATVFKGYTGEFEIRNVPDSLQITTIDGVKIPLANKPKKIRTKIMNGETGTLVYMYAPTEGVKIVKLPAKKDYVLLLNANGEEKRLQLVPRLGLGWFALDLICFGFPLIPDFITGNWYYYEDVDYKELP